ncbi:unknown protein [Simkania negevensis Z]|uniref:Uncharacterized protein n=1 Tax=Simkania negevensis (strain ATCC VR-1471 / DSM 27360 / Z) TaxID=331113 RepID=F8L9J5_SIMNZ|nr:unknown protein [Simkania negevensis Z]
MFEIAKIFPLFLISLYPFFITSVANRFVSFELNFSEFFFCVL